MAGSLGTAALKDAGEADGQLPTAPFSMADMPQAKRRLDIHTFESSLGSIARDSGSFVVSGLSDLATNSSIKVWQSPSAATGKGTLSDELEMDQVSVVAAPIDESSFRCYWRATGPVLGNFKFIYQIKNN